MFLVLVFSSCTVLSDSKETEIGSNNQEVSPSAGKNTGVFLVLCHRCKHVPTTKFQVICIFMGSLGVIICYDRRVHSEGHKNYFKDWCLINSAYLSVFDQFLKLNELWPYYQEDADQVTKT